MPDRSKLRAVLLLTLMASGACRARQPEQSTAKAFVTREQLDQAVEIARATEDYLPYQFTPDGCYARSYYMSMEFMVAGIPSSALVYRSTQPGVRLVPRQDRKIQWDYHVAPVFLVGADREQSAEQVYLKLEGGKFLERPAADMYIVDPSLYPQDIVKPATEWMADMTTADINTEMILQPAKGSIRDSPLLSPTEDLKEADYTGYVKVPRSIDEMEPFEWAQIRYACRVMSTYLGLVLKDSQDYAPRYKRLIDRTNLLLARLKSMSKLTGEPQATMEQECPAFSGPGSAPEPPGASGS